MVSHNSSKSSMLQFYALICTNDVHIRTRVKTVMGTNPVVQVKKKSVIKYDKVKLTDSETNKITLIYNYNA